MACENQVWLKDLEAAMSFDKENKESRRHDKLTTVPNLMEIVKVVLHTLNP